MVKKAEKKEEKKEKREEKSAETIKTGADDKAIKAAIKEGGKKGQDICGMSTFGVHFFCVTVDSAEGDAFLLEKVMEGMNAEVDPEAEERKGGAGDLGKCLFNATDKKLVMYCHVPKEEEDKATVEEWMEPILKVTHAKITKQTKGFIAAEVENAPEKGIFTLKLRDEGIAASFQFLRSKQLILDDDDGDDIDYTANSGVNLSGQRDY